MAEEEELTDAQASRLDYVDNAIYELVNDLVPESLKKYLPLEDEDEPNGIRAVPWDQEWISDLGERIGDVIFNAMRGLSPGDHAAFELAYRPYTTDEPLTKVAARLKEMEDATPER